MLFSTVIDYIYILFTFYFVNCLVSLYWGWGTGYCINKINNWMASHDTLVVQMFVKEAWSFEWKSQKTFKSDLVTLRFGKDAKRELLLGLGNSVLWKDELPLALGCLFLVFLLWTSCFCSYVQQWGTAALHLLLYPVYNIPGYRPWLLRGTGAEVAQYLEGHRFFGPSQCCSSFRCPHELFHQVILSALPDYSGSWWRKSVNSRDFSWKHCRL